MWNDDPESSFLGLGFRDASSTAQDAVQSLLQECLVYHEEQELIRQRQPTTPDHGGVCSRSLNKDGCLAKSCHSHSPSLDVAAAASNNVALSSDPTPVHPLIHSTGPPEPSDVDPLQLVNEGKAKALAVIARFQEQQLKNQRNASDRAASGHAAIGTTTDAQVNFAELRRACLAKEEERKQLAFIKNLEYVASKERVRIHQLEQQVAQTAAMEQLAKQQYELSLAQRKERLSKASISSSVTLPVQEFAARGNKRPRSKGQSHDPTTAAVYVTGLPMESDDATVPETLIRHLFGSYGTIVKVHLYRDKQYNRLKGDGLVVYRVEQMPRDILVETVCAQVSGCFWSSHCSVKKRVYICTHVLPVCFCSAIP
jgi:hypothetical protein